MAALTGRVTIATAGLLGWLAACGGKVEVARDGSGGSTSSTTSTSSGTTACPPNQPTETAPCALPPGQSCSYGDCCPFVYACEDGQWKETTGPCPTPACPPVLPEPGSSCACMQAPCPYNGASAACVNEAWQITCGGEVCGEGQLCVHTLGGNHCAPNDCNGAPSCDCTKACGDLFCGDVQGYQVDCAAP